MKVSLIIGKGKHAGKIVPVTRKQFVIGRHRKCQLTVSSNRVSVHHCAILIRKETAWVRDFDSTNGTFVNDERIKGDRQLRDSDLLRIGSLVLEVRFAPGKMDEEDVEGRRLSEKAAAKVMHEDSWSEVSGVLSPGPSSDYEITDIRIPAIPEEAVPKTKTDPNNYK
jgi:pSer/pThr/pTyr-binding forkhead associated (FHA) protein